MIASTILKLPNSHLLSADSWTQGITTWTTSKDRHRFKPMKWLQLPIKLIPPVCCKVIPQTISQLWYWITQLCKIIGQIMKTFRLEMFLTLKYITLSTSIDLREILNRIYLNIKCWEIIESSLNIYMSSNFSKNLTIMSTEIMHIRHPSEIYRKILQVWDSSKQAIRSLNC